MVAVGDESLPEADGGALVLSDVPGWLTLRSGLGAAGKPDEVVSLMASLGGEDISTSLAFAA